MLHKELLFPYEYLEPLLITLIPAWISNPMPSKVWDEIAYPFLNFKGCTAEIWEWISDFTPPFILDIIIYVWRDES